LKIYRVVRWFILAAAVITIGLMLQHPKRLVSRQVPAAQVVANATSFQSKLSDLEQAHQSGQTGIETRISSDEVAAAFAVSAASASSPASNTQPAQPTALSSQAGISADQVPLKDQQVVFDGDQVKSQFTTQVAGKDVVVTLSGHVGSKDGYVDFVPTSFAIGSMPVPISIVQEQVQKKLSDPGTHEQLKLPEFVSDLRVENGQLVIVEK
jgi:hypothetical protein